MDKLKLRVYDGVAVSVFIILPAILSAGLPVLIKQNGSAAWLTLLFAFIIMLCLFLILSSLMTKYEGMNIIAITSKVMGRPIGVLYGIISGVYFCFFTGVHIRECTEVLKYYSLHLTPVYVTAGLTLLPAMVVNLLGGKSTVKTTGFFFVILTLGLVFIILLGIKQYNPDNLAPVYGNELPALAKNGLFTASIFDGVIALFILAPAFSSASKIRKAGAISLVVSAAACILLSVCFIMTFPTSIGSEMLSGVMEMGKSSYINHFFYRFEALILPFLIFAAIVQTLVGLHIAKESFAQSFKLKQAKPTIFICVVLILTATFLPSNMQELTLKYLPLIRQFSVFFMAGFPLLLLLVSCFKRVIRNEKA